ncbi:MAG: hypothetical protein MHM6MM_000562 [Cercozoa sp. M6MM]
MLQSVHSVAVVVLVFTILLYFVSRLTPKEPAKRRLQYTYLHKEKESTDTSKFASNRQDNPVQFEIDTLKLESKLESKQETHHEQRPNTGLSDAAFPDLDFPNADLPDSISGQKLWNETPDDKARHGASPVQRTSQAKRRTQRRLEETTRAPIVPLFNTCSASIEADTHDVGLAGGAPDVPKTTRKGDRARAALAQLRKAMAEELRNLTRSSVKSLRKKYGSAVVDEYFLQLDLASPLPTPTHQRYIRHY